MTPCSEWCPFAACLACMWQGGKRANPVVTCDNRGADETALDGAGNTSEGLTIRHFSKIYPRRQA